MQKRIAIVTKPPTGKYLRFKSVDVCNVIALREVEKVGEDGEKMSLTEVTYKDGNGRLVREVSITLIDFKCVLSRVDEYFGYAHTVGDFYINKSMPFEVAHRESGWYLSVKPNKPFESERMEFKLKPDFEDYILNFSEYLNCLV